MIRTRPQALRNQTLLLRASLSALVITVTGSVARAHGGRPDYTSEFALEDCQWANDGSNRFFVLDPGHQIELAGEDRHEGFLEVTITVLPDTELVDGVTTRVVEEEELVDGEVVEISRNYFARCVETGAVYYFGEDVDDYEDGVVVGHEGSWRAGVDGAKPGLIMPATAVVGARYYQEVAPDAALDRAEHVGDDLTIETPAGVFEGCLEVDETTPLEPGEHSRKLHAPGIGLIFDDGIELVGWTPAP